MCQDKNFSKERMNLIQIFWYQNETFDTVETMEIFISKLKLRNIVALTSFELSELEYFKTLSQMSSYAHGHTFLYLLA